MSNINNGLKRVRKKIEILNVPNINWVLHDLIDEIDYLHNNSYNATSTQRNIIISNLKKKYLEIEKKLAPPDLIQSKMEL